MKEKNIATIQQLTSIQQALLIHNLQSKEDQGLIVVTAQLFGRLDLLAMQSRGMASWQDMRHLEAQSTGKT